MRPGLQPLLQRSPSKPLRPHRWCSRWIELVGNTARGGVLFAGERMDDMDEMDKGGGGWGLCDIVLEHCVTNDGVFFRYAIVNILVK